MSASLGRQGRALALYFVAALLFHAPHFLLQLADTNNDFYLHHFWVKDFAEGVMAGDFYPRWSSHARFGLGEPVFLFYSPLYYWSTSLFIALGWTPWHAMHGVEVISSTLFGWFIYLALKPFVRSSVAVGTGLVALFSPVLVGISYKFNGFPWGVAFVGYGMLLWAVMRPEARDDKLNWRAAVALALMTLLHTVSGLMGVLFFSVAHGARLLVLRPGLRAGLKSVFLWGVSVALGLALAGAYLIPAMGSLSLIDSAAWTQAYIPWHSFAFPTWSAGRYGMNWPAFQWPVAGLSLGVFLVSALMLRKMSTSSELLRSRYIYLCALGAGAVFIASELSYPLWLLDSPLRKIQYPWRATCIFSLAGLMLAALHLEGALRSGRTGSAYVARLLLGGCALVGVLSLGKATLLDGRPLNPDVARGQYTFEPFRAAFLRAGSECDGPERISRECIEVYRLAAGYVGLPEYAIKGSTAAAETYARRGLEGECAAKGAECSALPAARGLHGWRITTRRPVSLRMPLLAFPAWQMEADGVPARYVTDLETGLVSLEVPAGTHDYRFHWQRLPIEQVGLFVSLAGLLGIVVLVVRELGSRQRLVRPRPAEA